MKTKTITLLALAVLAAALLVGCAQDSTDTSSDNPEMQKQVMEEQSGSASTNPTRESSTGTKSGTAGNRFSLVANPSGELKWQPTTLKGEAGNVTISLTNESPVEHDVALAGSGGKILGQSKKVTKGSADLKIKDLKAGTYQYFCTIPGHKQAGMVGELTIR
jgi:nitrite reductase (NO-forming)